MSSRTGEWDDFLKFIRQIYGNPKNVELHQPHFGGKEKEYLNECIDSTYVSYVGKFVTEFESVMQKYTGATSAIALVNGTAAIHILLLSLGIGNGDIVITQALTFAATAAGICHSGALPALVDVDRDTLGMSPAALTRFLEEQTTDTPEGLRHRDSGQRIAAVMPMHTFGHPARIEEIAEITRHWGVELIEDAAESLGSLVNGRHTGTFGKAAVLSFNGNKTITTGGGGMVITSDPVLAERVRHLATTAKRKHAWEYYHDEVGYNFRMPNLNAAIGCAQMEQIQSMLDNKRETAGLYEEFLRGRQPQFFRERSGTHANYWLNAVIFNDRGERDKFLDESNTAGVKTRPVWTLLHKLPPYQDSPRGDLQSAEWLEDRLVNIPNGVRG